MNKIDAIMYCAGAVALAISLLILLDRLNLLRIWEHF